MIPHRFRSSPIVSRLRLPLLLCAMLVPAAPAAASTVYYAAPGGAGTTCTQALPCQLEYAVAHIGTSGDAILAEDGTYPISNPLDVRAGMTLAGEHTGGATLDVTNNMGASVTVESGATLRDLHVYASQGPDAVQLLDSATLLRADIRGIQDACVVAGSPVLIQDSVCDSTDVALGGTNTYDAVTESRASINLLMINDTFSAQTETVGVVGGGSVELINSIVLPRVQTTCPVLLAPTPALTFTSFNSDYPAIAPGCAPAGTTLEEHSHTNAPPHLVDASSNVSADFSEMSDSSTIGAGDTGYTAPMDTDIAGEPRVLLGKVDMGAYEYVQPPTMTAQPVTGLQPTAATLAAAVNNHGLASTTTFSYGLTAGSETTLPSGSQGGAPTDQQVTQTLTGLQPSTTYHWHACASVYLVSTCTADATFTTPATGGGSGAGGGGSGGGGSGGGGGGGSGGGGSGGGAGQPPAVGGAQVRGGLLTLTLSENASLIVTVSQKVHGHRRGGGRCKAGGKRGRRCTAVLTRARLTLPGAVGFNSFRVAAKLPPGRYTATIVAVDAAGRASGTVTIRFTVAKQKRKRAMREPGNSAR